MKEIAAKVPTSRDELAECQIPEHFQEEYGDRLLKNINAYIESENLHEIIERRPRKKLKRKMPKHPNLLSAKHTDELRSRIQKLVTMWADEVINPHIATTTCLIYNYYAAACSTHCPLLLHFHRNK
jgi:bisphosphoglycerate-dependent phosphoglycerate mutase